MQVKRICLKYIHLMYISIIIKISLKSFELVFLTYQDSTSLLYCTQHVRFENRFALKSTKQLFIEKLENRKLKNFDAKYRVVKFFQIKSFKSLLQNKH